MRSVLCSYRLTSYSLPETRLLGIMLPRTDLVETRAYRRERNREVLRRLICEVTPSHHGLFRRSLYPSRDPNSGHDQS